MIALLRGYFRDGPEAKAAASCWALAAGLLHSLILIGAFPPFGWWGLSFFAVIPIVLAAELRWKRPRLSALALYTGCLAFWMYQQAWTWPVSEAGYIPLCLYLTIYPAVFFVLQRRLRARLPQIPLWLSAAVLWTGLEVLRGEVVWHGYAWALIAHPLIESTWLSSPAPVLGQYLVSFLLMLASAGFAAALVAITGGGGRRVWGGLSGVGLAAAAWAVSGAIPGPASDAKPVVVGVVQTNIPQSNKMAATIGVELALWESLKYISERAVESGAQVVIWPETMKPGMTLDPESVEVERRADLGYRVQGPDGAERAIPSTAFVDELFDLQKRLGVPLVVGEDAFEGLRFDREGGGYRIAYDRRFNSAFVVENGRVSAMRYDKVHLTPFGEQMPYIEAVPWLKSRLLAVAAQNMKLDLAEGRGPVTLEAGLKDGRILRLATPICFEITDARLCRRMVASGGLRRAELLANLTNDGWFGDSDRTRLQHLQIARWRARELATPVVRAANTGISAAIDADGRLIGKAGETDKVTAAARDEGRLVRDITPASGLTIYARVGDVFTWSVLAAAVVLTIAGPSRRIMAGPGPGGGN
ncbi:MAG: apolipoprotein N-acyltransferase [Phycisphaerales bacterium]|nr:apolipoprotein N-acyltransferase [Phycisphaerales bacterium]